MATAELELDCAWTVDEIIKHHPATMAVFNRFGLDTCCGAVLSVKQAAHLDGVDAGALCAELHDAARPSWQARRLIPRRRGLRRNTGAEVPVDVPAEVQEEAIDAAVEMTFPASDPPAWTAS